MSNVHELSFLKEKIEELKKDGVYRTLPVLGTPSQAEVILNGKNVINLSSNNYLGFANHPRLKRAAIEAVEKYGALKGGLLSLWRIIRCNPFSKGGYDPVP